MDIFLFFFKQKTTYEMRISDWSSDVCSSDLQVAELREERNAWREKAQRLALNDQRAAPQPTPQRGFWSRLLSRQGDRPSGEEETRDAPTGPLGSQKQAIAYEVALESINEVIEIGRAHVRNHVNTTHRV